MFDWIIDIFNLVKDALPVIFQWIKAAVQMLVSSIVDIPVYTSLIPQPFGFILGISFCAVAICAFLRLFGSNLGGG